MGNGHTHPNGGGFVAASARVDDSVYVGKNAKVLGNATVSGNAVIDGYAIVTGSSTVSGNAVITGHAVVAERAQVKDNAIVGDYAGVMGNSVVSENARVLESGLVFNDYKVSGNATVKGVAYCLASGSASGQAMPDGDYYDDSGRGIQAGSVYGWTSPDTYVNSRPYNDGQYAGLDFDLDSSEIAADSFTSTYALAYGNPVWNEEKTSAKGVLTFTGDQYLAADSSYAALHDADYQTAVLLRDNGENSIFRFGNDEEYMSLTADNGNFVFEINDGSGTQSITAENAYELGAWTKVSVVINDDSAKLIVNGEIAASGSITADPVDIISDDSVYLIGDGMNGSMDYFRVNFKETAEPDYVYTEKEDITVPSGKLLAGDFNLDMKIDSYDMMWMRKVVIDTTLVKTNIEKSVADVNGDGSVNIADVVTMQSYLLGKIKEFPAGTFVTY